MGRSEEKRPKLTRRWYALSVYSRQERAAEAGLVERGFDVFFPTQPERRLWSDRIKTFDAPLFPGYLFLRAALDPRVRVEMLKVRQVRDLVGRLPDDNRVARYVPDHEIESLHKLVAAKRRLDPIEGLVEGAEVMVGQGPLKGARGVVLDAPDGRRRLVVQVRLLGRGVRALLHADDVLVDLLEV